MAYQSDVSYVVYNSPGSVNNANNNFLNRNTPVSQFPRRFYKNEPTNPSKTYPQFNREAGVIPYKKDTQVDYIIGEKGAVGARVDADRSKHPANFSRFGYQWCENGYCVGNHPGKYNTPESFQWQSHVSNMPSGLAPKRFYTHPDVDSNYCDSEAYINSRQARQMRSAGLIQ